MNAQFYALVALNPATHKRKAVVWRSSTLYTSFHKVPIANLGWVTKYLYLILSCLYTVPSCNLRHVSFQIRN